MPTGCRECHALARVRVGSERYLPCTVSRLVPPPDVADVRRLGQSERNGCSDD
jgi:hypothetical protein